MDELILSLSTATETISAALHRSGKTLLQLADHKPRSAGEYLPGMVAALFQKTDQNPHQLSAVAITSGPGSYTGLRIGTAFAKGLCYAQDLPLIPINTLEVLCHSAKCFPIPESTLLYALLDARRSHVYGLLMDHAGRIIQETHVCHITELKIKATQGYDHVYLVGSGVVYAHDLNLGSGYTLVEGDYPEARAVGQLAHQKWLAQGWVALNDFEPTYLSSLGAYAPKKPKPLV